MKTVHRSLIRSALAVCGMALGGSAGAVVVNPGAVVDLNGTSPAASPWLAGGSPSATVRSFVIRDASNNELFSGQLLASITTPGPFASARRYYSYRVQNTQGLPGREVVAMEMSGFGASLLDIDFRTDFSGPEPERVGRSPDGDRLLFEHPEGIAPGVDSRFTFVYTLATEYVNTGTVRILLNSGESVIVTSMPVPAPPVVPASCDGDTTGDGVINFADLNSVLSNFGSECP